MRKTTVQLEPMSYAMTEEMKTLRTNILFCGNDKKVITVTSWEKERQRSLSGWLLRWLS